MVGSRLNALPDNQLVADQLASNVNCPVDRHYCCCPAVSLVLGVCSVPEPALAPVLVLELVPELALVLPPVAVDADDVVAVVLAGEQLQLVSQPPPLQQLPLLDRRGVWVAVPVSQDDVHQVQRLGQVVHREVVVSCRLWGNQDRTARSHS